MALTDTRLRTLKPPKGKTECLVADGNGLYVRIRTGQDTSRTWQFRRKEAGRLDNHHAGHLSGVVAPRGTPAGDSTSPPGDRSRARRLPKRWTGGCASRSTSRTGSPSSSMATSLGPSSPRSAIAGCAPSGRRKSLTPFASTGTKVKAAANARQGGKAAAGGAARCLQGPAQVLRDRRLAGAVAGRAAHRKGRGRAGARVAIACPVRRRASRRADHGQRPARCCAFCWRPACGSARPTTATARASIGSSRLGQRRTDASTGFGCRRWRWRSLSSARGRAAPSCRPG